MQKNKINYFRQNICPAN